MDAVEQIGRSQERHRVLQRLCAEPPQSVAVVGDPGIGKTTFLRSVLVAEVRAAGHAYPEGTVVLWLPMDASTAAGPTGFFEGVGAACRSQALVLPGANFQGFESMCTAVHERGGRLILLMDDFNRITSSASFPLEFFAFLRSLASRLSVACVTSSRGDLQTLCALKEVEQSPFFNIFQNFPLRPLGREDAARLAALWLERLGRPDERAAREVADLAGGLPRLIEEAARTLVDRESAAGTRDDLVLACLERADAFLGELWESFDFRQRDLLRVVARGAAPAPTARRTLRELGTRRGYLVGDDAAPAGHGDPPDEVAFRSPVLAEYVRRQAAQSSSWAHRIGDLFRRG